jgi:hypothetical protein
MGTMIVILCVSACLNLALWAALYRRLDGLPLRLWSMAKTDREAGDSRALTLLQERTAAKVGDIVSSLRTHEEHVADAFRAQVAEAEIRARVSERRSSEAGVALSVASGLVRELRELLDGPLESPRAPLPSVHAVTEGRATVALGPEAIDTTRKPDRPEPASRERPAQRGALPSGIAPMDDGERLSEDEMTQVARRPLPAQLEAGKTLVSPAGTGGAR